MGRPSDVFMMNGGYHLSRLLRGEYRNASQVPDGVGVAFHPTFGPKKISGDIFETKNIWAMERHVPFLMCEIHGNFQIHPNLKDF